MSKHIKYISLSRNTLSKLVICVDDLLNNQVKFREFHFLYHNPVDAFNFIKKNFEFRISAGGVVRNEAGEILMIYKNNIWDLPKGHVMGVEELVEDCAKREVFEETNVSGLKISSASFSTYHMYIQNNVSSYGPLIEDDQLVNDTILKETKWFLMTAKKNQHIKPQLTEGITIVKWVPGNMLKDIKTYNSIKEVFSYFQLI